MRRRQTAVGVGLVLLLGGLWWITREGGNGPRGKENGRATAGASELEDGGVVAPASLEEGGGVQAADVPSTPVRAQTPRVNGPRGSALLHGHLVIAGSEDALDEVLRVRLHTGDPARAETLETAADGTFASTVEFQSGIVMAKVMGPDGAELVDQELPFDPALDADWVVSVPWPTYIRGRIVDRARQPQPNLRLAISRLDAGSQYLGHWTNARGAFEFIVSAGPSTLYVQSGFERCEFPLVVRRGLNDLGDLCAPFGDVAGEISGRLLAADGAPEATLLLLDPTRGIVASTAADPDPQQAGVSLFSFEGVPAGDYQLELVACDGRRYEPAARRVTPPATELVFEARGAQDLLRLQAIDGDRELVTFALVRIRGQWLSNSGHYACADVERWTVLAPDHRPQAGERAETCALRVRLEPGFGQAYLFTEVGGELMFPTNGGHRGRALAGVELVADGRTVATSDADGLAVLSLATAPSELRFHLAGWRQQSEGRIALLGLVEFERE